MKDLRYLNRSFERRIRYGIYPGAWKETVLPIVRETSVVVTGGVSRALGYLDESANIA